MGGPGGEKGQIKGVALSLATHRPLSALRIMSVSAALLLFLAPAGTRGSEAPALLGFLRRPPCLPFTFPTRS